MNIDEKLENLSMTPDDWGVYNSLVDFDTYRKTVNLYQKREFSRLPQCNVAFGICIYYCGGHCTRKNEWCKHQSGN